jgi:hypothetical protein
VSKLVEDEEFEKQLELLNSVLYSGKDCDFNPGVFLKVFDKVNKKQKKHKKHKKLLPDLYK